MTQEFTYKFSREEVIVMRMALRRYGVQGNDFCIVRKLRDNFSRDIRNTEPRHIPPKEIDNRRAVTAKWLFEHPDCVGYIYNSNNCWGDPWTMITGVDVRMNDGRIILEYGQMSEIVVERDYEVYVSIKELEKI